MKNSPYEGTDRRTYLRVIYHPTKRSKLIVGKHEFEIADISEGGIRFISNKKIKIEKRLRGTVAFLFGESNDIEGDIVWEQNGELGLLLKSLIPPATMEREKRFVILDES